MFSLEYVFRKTFDRAAPVHYNLKKMGEKKVLKDGGKATPFLLDYRARYHILVFEFGDFL